MVREKIKRRCYNDKKLIRETIYRDTTFCLQTRNFRINQTEEKQAYKKKIKTENKDLIYTKKMSYLTFDRKATSTAKKPPQPTRLEKP